MKTPSKQPTVTFKASGSWGSGLWLGSGIRALFKPLSCQYIGVEILVLIFPTPVILTPNPT